jgi:hypothetical protein
LIPQDAASVVEQYLQLADQALPGRIEGLYLTGSIALGDYKPDQSDVDFVAVTQGSLVPDDLDRLEQVHRDLQAKIPRPWFSGVYVTWDDLQSDPTQLRDVPFHLEGEFKPSGGFDANPVTWLTLRNYPVAVRGPGALSVWHDPAVIRQWALDNLNSYWQSWVSHNRRLAGRGVAMLIDWSVCWCVSGVPRLHFTLSSGDVTSKSGACRYALSRFPERWHPIVAEALALRSGEPSQGLGPLARRRQALDFAQFVIDDANAMMDPR